MAETERGERADWFVINQLTEDPTEVGELRNKSGDIIAKDKLGSFNLRSGGGGGADFDKLLITKEGALISAKDGWIVIKK